MKRLRAGSIWLLTLGTPTLGFINFPICLRVQSPATTLQVKLGDTSRRRSRKLPSIRLPDQIEQNDRSQETPHYSASVGLGLTCFVVLGLAMADMTVGSAISSTVVEKSTTASLPELALDDIIDYTIIGVEDLQDLMERAGKTVIQAALPLTSSSTGNLVLSLPDTIAVLLSETLAGFLSAASIYIGSVTPLLVRRYMRLKSNDKLLKDRGVDPSSGGNAIGSGKMGSRPRSEGTAAGAEKRRRRMLEMKKMTQGMGSGDDMVEAVARADYIYARTSVRVVLQLLGVTGEKASTVSVLLAQLPYQLVKSNMSKPKTPDDSTMPGGRPVVEVKTAETEEKPGFIRSTIESIKSYPQEFVSVSTDLIKWLEYDVLSTSWVSSGSTLTGVSAAAFGFVAALSSELYRDLTLSATALGAGVEGQRIKNRSVKDTAKHYAALCCNNAAFFGLFETVRSTVRHSHFLPDLLDLLPKLPF